MKTKVNPTKEQIADLKRLASALPGGLGSGSPGVWGLDPRGFRVWTPGGLGVEPPGIQT